MLFAASVIFTFFTPFNHLALFFFLTLFLVYMVNRTVMVLTTTATSTSDTTIPAVETTNMGFLDAGGAVVKELVEPFVVVMTTGGRLAVLSHIIVTLSG